MVWEEMSFEKKDDFTDALQWPLSCISKRNDLANLNVHVSLMPSTNVRFSQTIDFRRDVEGKAAILDTRTELFH